MSQCYVRAATDHEQQDRDKTDQCRLASGASHQWRRFSALGGGGGGTSTKSTVTGNLKHRALCAVTERRFGGERQRARQRRATD